MIRRLAFDFLISLALFVSFGALPLVAQAGGSISGTVKDASGAVMPGVTVTLTNVALGTQSVAMTDGQGVYSFPNVPVGRYDLSMPIDGFKPQKRTGIAVDTDSASADRRHARARRAE